MIVINKRYYRDVVQHKKRKKRETDQQKDRMGSGLTVIILDYDVGGPRFESHV